VASERDAILFGTDVGVNDVEGEMDRFVVGEGSLAMQPVSTGLLAVVRGEDDNRALTQVQRIELFQNLGNFGVDGAYAVDVVVVKSPPAILFEWYLTQQVAPYLQILAVCFRTSRRIQRFA
jgi:hypothetical protein